METQWPLFFISLGQMHLINAWESEHLSVFVNSLTLLMHKGGKREEKESIITHKKINPSYISLALAIVDSSMDRFRVILPLQSIEQRIRVNDLPHLDR